MAYRSSDRFGDYKTGLTDFRTSRPYSADDHETLKRSFRRSVSPPTRLSEIGIGEESRIYRNLDFARTEPDLRSSMKIYELQSKLASKEAQINELERDLRSAQDIEAQQSKTMKHMQSRIDHLERDTRDFSTVHSKGELTIATLQTDNRQLQERILELEERLRKNLDAKESASHTALNLERYYDELKHFLCTSLFPDSYHDTRSHDNLMRKLKDFMAEDIEMRSRVRKIEDNLRAAEDELQRNRDTVKKLLEDIDRSKRYIANTDLLKQERDTAFLYQNQMKDDLKRMEERLLNNREEWERAQHELRQQQVKLADVDVTIKKHELSTHATATEFRAFKETLATLLSDGYVMIPNTEDAIKDKIRQLMLNKQDVNKVSRHLEDKLTEVSKQLEEQAQLHKSAVQRARKAESDMERFRHQLKGAEGELVATDILKDGLKGEKQKYVEFLKQMADVMRMDRIVEELGIDLNGDALLLRAEQLIKMEDQAMGMKTVESLAMQRQMKEMKKELESRDMHMDLLKKKLTSSEYTAEQDWDDVIDKNKKLVRQVEKFQRQLQECKQTIQAIKAESVENKALKITADEQRKTIRELERRLGDLEDVRTKQSRRIAGLKHDKEQTQIDASHGLQVTETTMQSISNELQRVKRLLEDAHKREKQLLDLRQVIARMLGLDVNRLAVPDFEIISRLEKLVEAQHEIALEYRGGERGASADPLKQGYMLEAQRRAKMRSKEPPGAARRWK